MGLKAWFKTSGTGDSGTGDKKFDAQIKSIDDDFKRYGQSSIVGWLEDLEIRVRKLEKRKKKVK